MMGLVPLERGTREPIVPPQQQALCLVEGRRSKTIYKAERELSTHIIDLLALIWAGHLSFRDCEI